MKKKNIDYGKGKTGNTGFQDSNSLEKEKTTTQKI